MFCKKCGAQLDGSANFCMNCGERIDQNSKFIFCKGCGAKYPRGQIFCTNCGLRMASGTKTGSSTTRVSSSNVSSAALKPQAGTAIKVYRGRTYYPLELTSVNASMPDKKLGSFVFKNDSVEIYKMAALEMVVGALAGTLPASNDPSNGGRVKPVVVIPYENILRYIPSNLVMHYNNYNIIIYMKDGNAYTLCFEIERLQQEALAILKSWCRL